ncbi:MAG: Smr/MutS family protein [Tabrizicola sp.]|jgi:DNA-nicking Smr family endonuclease|uniref:Smr/MutS family protein n=1 Tax=Tabrizicola sp. TaxID=2005166 RepID=UPI001B7735BF|nr:Smr/MutS family protein [Tabrizicola sp.]
MARRRHLSPEESDLWRTVARTARSLHSPPIHLPDPSPAPEPAPLAPAKPRLSPFLLGEKHRKPEQRDLAPTLPDLLGQTALRMDAGTHAKMTRGKLHPEARIDLHGLTLAEAHPELIRFILNAQSQGLRLVLVITGKGKRRDDTGPIPQRVGALRHQVPHWLHLPPLGPAVLQVSEAHLKHGGGGAYYVYLRKR